MKKSTALSGLVSLLVCSLALPVSASGLDQLHEFIAQTHSARGDFTQKVQRTSGETLESTSGSFAFARPGKFRWEVKQPFEQLMVSDGKQLWFYDHDLNQVTIRALGDALGSTPAAILFGSADLDSGFKLSELAPHDGLEWIEALPRNTGQGFERIAIGFADGLPKAMVVRDAFNRDSLFTFTHIVRNPQIPASQFSFTPPPDADVVGQ